MGKDAVQFVPFHAINEFMRDDFRLDLIRATLIALPGLTANIREPVERLIRKQVQVPGFRNPMKAPIGMRIKPTVEAFMKSPALVASVLEAWTESHPELCRQVFDLLTSRGWEILPIEADRSKIPGFLITWPSGEDFEGLYKIYNETYPSSEFKQDEVSLMIVWLSGSLPYSSNEEELLD